MSVNDEIEGPGHGLFWGTTLALPWESKENHIKPHTGQPELGLRTKPGAKQKAKMPTTQMWLSVCLFMHWYCTEKVQIWILAIKLNSIEQYFIQGVRMKAIQNTKFISQKLIVMHVCSLHHWKEKLLKVFFSMVSLYACASWWPSATSVTMSTPLEYVQCVLWLAELQSLMAVQCRFRTQYIWTSASYVEKHVVLTNIGLQVVCCM
jgi:hypothetical protein